MNIKLIKALENARSALETENYENAQQFGEPDDEAAAGLVEELALIDAHIESLKRA